ncbi:hypothetical protein Sjap_000152 [Stephania japonica]|uniref:Polyphenol oxidase C-terminal domain-containing protein n=1 Tax=Stephania japonica TaxID=461633 RepID=A0AAP0KJV4_9MAGN
MCYNRIIIMRIDGDDVAVPYWAIREAVTSMRGCAVDTWRAEWRRGNSRESPKIWESVWTRIARPIDVLNEKRKLRGMTWQALIGGQAAGHDVALGDSWRKHVRRGLANGILTRGSPGVHKHDVLNIENLGYTYTSEVNAWGDVRKRYKKERLGRKRSAKEHVQPLPVSEFGTEPRPLKEPIRILVQRPKTSRSKQEKEDDLEVLVIDDIEYEHGQHSSFDVFISKPIEGLAGPDYGDHAAHFNRLPHFHIKKEHHSERKAQLELGITNLLDDIDAETSDNLVVTLVPKQGKVTIGGVFIELQESDL